MESKALRVKNRRMAELERLIEEGEYFGDTAMRDREPLLFKQYITKYTNDPLAARPNKPRTLSESLMQSAEEQELQQRYLVNELKSLILLKVGSGHCSG